jgi:MFS family permease
MRDDSGVKIASPLRHRDFALLWSGMAISAIGDGLYFVAIAFQVYALSNKPSALSIVGFAWSVGFLALVLTGGVVSDRIDRRRLLMAADAVRMVVLAAVGALSLAGVLELWHLVVLVLFYGSAEAFFGPAFHALIPDMLPADELVAANALEGATRPAALRLVGPALGGGVVALAGPGGAFLVDAGTFAVSLTCVALMRTGSRAPQRERRPMLAEMREGLVFVRSQTWLWATLVAAAVALLVFYGPVEVLIPYLIKNDLGGGAGAFGLFLSAIGLGSVLGSLWMGRHGMPRRPITHLYLWWGLGTFPIAGYALATGTWQLMVLGFVFGVANSMGMVVWTTLMQSRVPSELRGRVNSLDWFVSLGLIPVSFALTGPCAAAFGVDATLIGAGLLGGCSTLALLAWVPGLRERSPSTPAEARG